jgi:hypothetical protein
MIVRWQTFQVVLEAAFGWYGWKACGSKGNLIFAGWVIHVLPDETTLETKYPPCSFPEKIRIVLIFPVFTGVSERFGRVLPVLLAPLHCLLSLLPLFCRGTYKLETFCIFCLHYAFIHSQSLDNQAFQVLFNIILIIRQMNFRYFVPYCAILSGVDDYTLSMVCFFVVLTFLMLTKCFIF